jgi:type III secretion system YscI/HrpB-like protein
MTDLSGIQQAVQKIAEQTLQDQAKSGLGKGASSAEDVQKLQAALNQPPAEAQAANGAAPTQGVERVNGVEQLEPTSSPGVRLLESVHNMRTGLNDAMLEMTNVLANTNELSAGDMMRAQMKFQQISMQQDLMSKVVSKSEQNIDQLLKGQ